MFFFFSSRRRHTRCALVTGVQTCALPISRRTPGPRRDNLCVDQIADVLPHVERRHGQHFEPLWLDIAGDVIEQLRRVAPRARAGGEERSDERRVGKECGSTCRSWWLPYN